MVILLFLLIFGVIVYRWISLERWRLTQLAAPPAEVEPTPTPTPKPTRPPVISGKLDTARLFNGITLHSDVETVPGGAASDERIDPRSYVLDLKLQAHVPAPNKSIDELAK